MIQAPRTYTPAAPIWCAGCGHFGVFHALRAALRDLEVPAHKLIVLAGIGCSGTIQNYVGAYGYHALHGRVLPAATGVALADPDLTVVAAGGDGDGYAIGVGHLVHAFRRNPSIAYLLMNNETYGLTKGQRSPSRLLDRSAGGEGSLDGTLLGLSVPGTTFVARGYSGRFEQLARLTRAALAHARAHRGFAFLEVVSPCVTYQDTYPQWDQVFHDVDGEPGYDVADRAVAFATAARAATEGRLAVGLLYQAPPPTVANGRPAPARAAIEPAALASGYQAILDRYAPGAVREAKSKRRTPIVAGPAAGDDFRSRALVSADVSELLALVDRDRLPAQPPVTEGDLQAVLPSLETSQSVSGDPHSTLRGLAVTKGGRLVGAASCIRVAEETTLLWMHGGEDPDVLRALIRQLLEVEPQAPVRAFNLPTAVSGRIPGLPVGRRSVTHHALLELGFRPAERWLYMVGAPAGKADRIADVITRPAPNQWRLTVLYGDEPAAEARVELGPTGGIVRWLGVAEALRGHGLGRRLLDEATHLLGEAGAERIALYVVEGDRVDGTHRAAVRLYDRAGFRVVDHLAGYRRDYG